MKILVQTCLELKGKTLPLAHTYDLQYLTERDQHLLRLEPITFEGKGEMQAGIFIVSGELSGACTLRCSRCLEDVNLAFRQPFLERFNIQAKAFQNEQDEMEGVHEVTGKEIDLLPFIEEEVLISIPFVPVCADEETCESNRVTSGKDWSMLVEDQKEDRVDPRLAELAKFFDKK